QNLPNYGPAAASSSSPPPVPFDHKIHLRAKCRAPLLAVKISEKRIIFAIHDSPRVHAVGQESRQGGFAHAQGPFDGDVTRRLECRRLRHAAFWRATHGARLQPTARS